MPTSEKTIDSVRKALALVPEVSFQRMAGEYRVYSRGRLFAMVCNDELLLKVSPETLCLFRDPATRTFPDGLKTCKANGEWLLDPEKLGEAVLYTLAIHTPQPKTVVKTRARRSGALRRLARLPWEKTLIFCITLAAIYFMLPYKVLGALGIHKGVKAGDFALTGSHGGELRLSDCGGKPVFLYVWKTNSQQSIENLPMLDSLYAAYKERPVCFIPVSITADFNVVKAFARAKDLQYPVYNGAGRFKPEQTPMLYLLDGEGYLRDSYSPSGADGARIIADLEGLLGAAVGARARPAVRKAP